MEKPVDDQPSAPPLNQVEDEEAFIKDSLDFINGMFDKFQLREPKLPADSQRRLSEFKDKWRTYFSDVAASNEATSSVAVGAMSHDSAEKSSRREQGAIPKTKRASSSNRPLLHLTSSECDAQHSDSSSSADIFPKRSTVAVKPSKSTTVSQPQSVSSSVRLDMRSLLPFEKFGEDAGVNLRTYLQRFEDYCTTSFRVNSDLWKGELDRCLTGKTLKAYRSLRYDGDSYEDVKQKLLEWYDDMQALRNEKNKLDFRRARIQEDESMHLFAQRLVRLFKVAFPHRRTSDSKTLREKYVAAVPKTFRKFLQSQMMNSAVRGNLITWQEICICARHFDLETLKNADNSSDASDTSPEADVAVSAARAHHKKAHDASTQCTVQAEQLHSQASSADRSGETVSRSPKRDRQTWDSSMRGRVSAGNRKGCRSCGRLGHFARDCRARFNQCYSCGSREHFIRDCPWATRASLRAPRSSSQPAVARMRHQYERQFSATSPSDTRMFHREPEMTVQPDFTQNSTQHQQSNLNSAAPTQWR